MSYFYEARATKNGVPLSVQVLHRRLPDGISHKHPLHYHDYTELLFGLTGAASVLIGADTLPLTPGDMIIIHNGVPHNVIAEGDEDCTYTVVKFLPQILFAGEQSYSEYAYAFLLMENTPGRRILFSAGSLQNTDIAERFARLEEEFFAQAFGYELALRAEVTAIVLFILRRWQKEDPARFAAYDQMISETFEFDGLVGMSIDYVMAHKYFYDNAFHPNDYGRTYRTHQLYRDLCGIFGTYTVYGVRDVGTDFAGCLFESGSMTPAGIS